jgi:hypothetical protein
MLPPRLTGLKLACKGVSTGVVMLVILERDLGHYQIVHENYWYNNWQYCGQIVVL